MRKAASRHDMPAHHLLETYMDEYIAEARIADDKPSPLFRTAFGKTGTLTDRRMHLTDALRMIWRRARGAGIETELGCHSFRATGITVYLERRPPRARAANGRARERADDEALRPAQRQDHAR